MTRGVYDVPNINVFCRGFDPTALRDVTLISLNGPTRIGQTTVLPGDIVLGTRVRSKLEKRPLGQLTRAVQH